MKHWYLVSVLSLFLIGEVVGQAPNHMEQCGYNLAIQQREQRLPGYKNAVEAAHQQAQGLAAVIKDRYQKVDTIYRIPVVVHIVYNAENQNLPDSLVHQQMAILNADFQRANADTSNAREIYETRAGRMPIEFVLAKVDPKGNPTNGITRTKTNRISFFNQSNLELVKAGATGGIDPWDTKKYLNIWVCNISVFGQDILLGYAYPPTNAPHWPQGIFPEPQFEGVVVHNKVFGPNNYLLPATGAITDYNKGRTLVHEVGHYLGLRHIWGDGDCTQDDGVSDTPLSDNSSGNCDVERNSCLPLEEPDMYENYMDYSTDRCQNMFTKGQTDLMFSNLLLYRSELSQKIVLGLSESELKVYPIPASNYIDFELRTFPNSTVEVEALDLTGKLVLRRSISADSFVSERLLISNLAPGMYTFVFKLPDGVKQYKIPVVRD